MLLLVDRLTALRLVLRYLPIGPALNAVKGGVLHVHSLGELCIEVDVHLIEELWLPGSFLVRCWS